jgi:hypothetical protein
MPALPWVYLSTVQPTQEYLVLLSYLPLKHWRKLPLFLRYVTGHPEAIEKHGRSPGIFSDGSSLQPGVLDSERLAR